MRSTTSRSTGDGESPSSSESRFENGLWREDHVVWDQFGMLQQLGVIPMPEAVVA